MSVNYYFKVDTLFSKSVFNKSKTNLPTIWRIKSKIWKIVQSMSPILLSDKILQIPKYFFIVKKIVTSYHLLHNSNILIFLSCLEEKGREKSYKWWQIGINRADNLMQRKMDHAIKCYWKVKIALNNLLSVKNAIETLSYLYLFFIDVFKKYIS